MRGPDYLNVSRVARVSDFIGRCGVIGQRTIIDKFIVSHVMTP
jgi:hypothetical protein